MKQRHVLVSDIDGTLLQNGKATPGLRVVKQMLQHHADKVALVYATGRSFASTWKLISDGILPEPSAIAPFIGTEFWVPSWSRHNLEYEDLLLENWDREEILFWAKQLFDLIPQEDHFQSPLKLSFYMGRHSKLYDLDRFLVSRNLEAKVVYSCGKFVDIIPKNGGKANAVRYLSRIWGVEPRNILTCGDSGNDMDMLMDPHTCNVAVGNLESELHKLKNSGRFYTSELPFAAGVLEGAAAFDFWPKMASPKREDNGVELRHSA